MKKQFVMVGIILITVLCAGCGDDSISLKKDAQEETAEPKEYDPLAGYKEFNGPEEFGEEVSFEITGELRQTVPDNLYSNTDPDGSIRLFSYVVTAGTPYQIAGPVYDHEMFSMRTYVKRKDDSSHSDGGGSVMDQYWFTPKYAGETEIMVLNSHLSVYEGTIYHITVEDDLTCRMDWYAGVTQGENMELIGVSSE